MAAVAGDTGIMAAIIVTVAVATIPITGIADIMAVAAVARSRFTGPGCRPSSPVRPADVNESISVDFRIADPLQ